MRIAFLGPAPPFRGGISSFAAHLAETLAQAGHLVCYFNFIKQYPAFLFPSAGQESGSKPGLPSQRVLTPYKPCTWLKTVKALKDWQPDIIIVSWWLPFFAPAYEYVLKRVKGKKLILAHNILPHEAWPGTKFFLKRVFRQADKLIVLSQSCQKDIEQLLGADYAEKTLLAFHPIYDSITMHKAREELPEGSANLLFFGLIKEYKGLDVLLKAMPRVIQALPNARLIIAGSVYGKAEPYYRLIRELQIESHIETHFRYLKEQEVAEFFAQNEVCLLPYKSATQSGVIATAFSYNTPVIASDVGGLGEYIESGLTGFLVPPNDPEALADAIIRFYQEKHYQSMYQAVEQEKPKYTWEAFARLILD